MTSLYVAVWTGKGIGQQRLKRNSSEALICPVCCLRSSNRVRHLKEVALQGLLVTADVVPTPRPAAAPIKVLVRTTPRQSPSSMIWSVTSASSSGSCTTLRTHVFSKRVCASALIDTLSSRLADTSASVGSI